MTRKRFRSQPIKKRKPDSEKEKLDRAQACIAAINATLQKYNCMLSVQAGTDPEGRIIARAAITAQGKPV